MSSEPLIIHASSVALNGRALLIRGRSGSGKSSLALQLMAFGAGLIADDRTALTVEVPGLVAACPDAIRGQIEARHMGILRADPHPPAPVACCIDLDRTETERLPMPRSVTYLGQDVPLYFRIEGPTLAASLIQLLRHGRID